MTMKKEFIMEKTKANGGALVPVTTTPEQLTALDKYANTASGGFFGDLLKYSGKDGSWTAGPQGVEVEHGTHLVAIIPAMLVGHVKWRDGELVDQALVPLTPGFDPKEHRATLDESDRSLWKVDEEGRAKDPWSEAALLPMINPKTGAKYSFSTSSVGGVNCVKHLIKAYTQQMRAAPETTAGHLPLVELGGRSYKHSIKARGTIHNPVLNGIDWVLAADVLVEPPVREEEQPAFEDYRAPKDKKRTRARL
jgi:hypothetical protein